MTLRVFISSATNQQAAAQKLPDPLRSWLIAQLVRSGSHLVYQESLIETGVNTLVKLSQEINKQDVVIHIVGEDPGRVPSDKIIDELLRCTGNSKVITMRFPELLQDAKHFRLTYTQWEAWLGKYYDRDVVCFYYCLKDSSSTQAANSESNANPLSTDEHLEMLKPYAGYATRCSTREELLTHIQENLLRRLNDKPSRVFSSRWTLAMLIGVLLLIGVAGVSIYQVWRSDRNKPQVDSTSLFAEQGAASDGARLKGVAEYDVRAQLQECVTPSLQRLGNLETDKLSDADLIRFVEVLLACQENSDRSSWLISDNERTTLARQTADPLTAARDSTNIFIRELANMFSDSPTALSTILKELSHE